MVSVLITGGSYLKKKTLDSNKLVDGSNFNKVKNLIPMQFA